MINKVINQIKNKTKIRRNSQHHMTMFHIKRLPSHTIRPFIRKPFPTMSTHPRITPKMNNLHLPTTRTTIQPIP